MNTIMTSAPLIAFVSILFASRAKADQEVTLSLEDAKRYAVSHNYGIAALRFEVDETQKRQNKASAPFLPKFGVATGIEASTREKENDSQTLGYVYGSYNLFNRYQDTTSKEISKLEHEKSLLKLAAAEFAVKLDVEEIFHTFLFKKNLINLKNKEIELNEKHRQLVHQTREKGLVSDTDVMEFQLKDSNLRSDLIALNQELEDARSNLKRLLGDDIGGNVTPIGQLQHQHVKGDLMDVLNRIQESAQSVKTAALDVNIARSEQKISDSKWLPQIDFEVRSGFLPQEGASEQNKRTMQTSIALVAKMDLYTGRENYWEKQEKAANSQKKEASLKDEINVAIRKIEMGYRNLKVIEARADLEKDNISFAEKYYASVLNEYRRGFKNSADLASATEKISSAKSRKLNFEFDSIKQRIDVERTLGTSLEIEVESNTDATPAQGGNK